ncbi:MAG TPA: hypothetical protein VIE64_05920 [Solirubrobacterales bacterium]|jgi:hypothetical protein
MTESQNAGPVGQLPERTQPDKEKRKRGQDSNGWWWLPIGRSASCSDCKKGLSPPEKVAYSYPTKKIYCPDCAQKQQVAEMCKPSRKLQKDGPGSAEPSDSAEPSAIGMTEPSDSAEPSAIDMTEPSAITF